MSEILERSEGFLSEKYEDGTMILMHQESGTAHVLNSTSTLIYELCIDAVMSSDLVDRFCSEINFDLSDISEAEVRTQVQAAISEFLEKGILRVANLK